MASVNLNDIGKSTSNFSFVDALGSFINNMKFKDGFDQFARGTQSKDTYIWHALSCIGEQYGNVIYENVINYLDNAANVDLCKIKALQSMMKVVGVKYDVLDAFSHIPVEIANLMDLFSVNNKYLLDSKTFKQEFIDQLSSFGAIKTVDPSSVDLDNILSATEYEPDIHSRVSADVLYVDEEGYSDFLSAAYRSILDGFVFMKYADAENGLSTEKQYIYEYIQNDILAGQQTAVDFQQTQYEKDISQLKIQYNIDKSFDQQAIVDNIENGYDSYSNYNIFQQQVLDYEIKRRQDTYAYHKTYELSANDDQVGQGYNLTRYSYYREKKVKEYFKFIEDTYNNLIIEDSVKNAIENDLDVDIQNYSKDINYFDIDQSSKQHLLQYDETNNQIEVQTYQIQAITQLLVQQTLAIANIRDQVKTQIRKSYMRGTFLLISYIVNEFLKYNIAEKYGSTFQTEDTGVELGTILSTSIMQGDNVELIEYYDPTEYFNITRDVDPKAKNSDTVNEKFWDNVHDKIGKVTHDLPLDEIERFYLKQMKLERNKVDDVVNFLSIIYEYGANNSYISRSTGEYTCMISGRTINDGPTYIGDPYNYISSLNNDIAQVNTIHDGIDKYIANGAYIEDASTIKPMPEQIDYLCGVVSTYYYGEISTANEQTKENIIDQLCNDFDQASTIAGSLNDISAEYEGLKVDPKYAYYLVDNIENNYEELTNPPAYFIEKLYNFKLSIDNGIKWRNQALDKSLGEYLAAYDTLSSDLFTKLFALSVWPINAVKQPTSLTGNKYYNKATTYWPHYSPHYDDELTTITLDLKNYLTSEVQVQHDGALQHLQNHYDKLLGYKEDINTVLNACNNAAAKLEAFKDAVEAATGIPSDEDLTSTVVFFDKTVYEMSAVISYEEEEVTWTDKSGKEHTKTYKVPYIEDYIPTKAIGYIVDSIDIKSPAIEGTVKQQLQALQQRCEYPTYPVQDERKVMVGSWPDDEFSVAQYYDDIGGWATVIENDHIGYKEYDIEIDDDGNEKAVATHKELIYAVPVYKYAPRIYTNKDIVEYKWKDHYSQEIENDILAAYNNAVASLTSTVELINSELECLGYTSIDQPDSDIDSVRTDTADVYTALIDRIDDLTKKMQSSTEANGWQSLTSDQNILPFINRLKSISAINLSIDENYNIRSIDNRFNAINLSVQQLLADNSEYFDMYVNNDADRLDKQILAISAYMIDRDSQASAEVLSTALDLSARYYDQLDEFGNFSLLLNRQVVDSINNDYSYNMLPILYRDEVYSKISSYLGGDHYDHNTSPWPLRMADCLDYLLCGDYINYEWTDKLSGVLYWLPNSSRLLENSIVQQINLKIPQLPEYIEITDLLDIAKNKYAERVNDEDMLLTEKLDAIVQDFQDEIVYISGQVPFYDKSHEIYLKYNGTEIGYDPFYNHKNMAYSSYQIHPYLYNFVEKSNIIHPLANNFFVAFGDDYETEIVSKGLDEIIGQYGNVKNIWKSGLFDWTSYQSKYERQAYKANYTEGAQHPNNGYTGLFYPPAIAAFLADRDKFLQDVQDDMPDSYYHHLNLTNGQRNKIYEQLLAYEYILRDVATAQRTNRLSGEYDIYKYAEDCMGNSIFLLKSYRHLYEQHKDDPNYRPSYHEKRNTLGEIWMRVKDHPIAFPAIDLRGGYADISQYSIKKTANSLAEDINSYVKVLDDYFKRLEEQADVGSLSSAMLARDTIGQYQIDGLGKQDLSDYDKIDPKDAQHLRCFFDFEMDVTHQSILLAVPFRVGQGWQQVYYPEDGTGTSSFTPLDAQNIRYADSSIVIAYLGNRVLFNSMSDQTNVYWFKADTYVETNANIDNIQNKQMLVNGSIDYQIGHGKKSTAYFSEFVGFAKNDMFVYALYCRKYFEPNGGTTFVHNASSFRRPTVELDYIGYRCHMQLDQQTAQSEDLLYDVYDYKHDPDQQKALGLSSYINASSIAMASGNKHVTIGFLTRRQQTYSDGYGNNTQVVNFTEYTAQMESYNALSSSGENIDYPRSTALVQTKDSQRINIYNSFDSFVQYLVNVTFKFTGTALDYESTQYFNLNSDLGYLPQYVDKQGISYYNKNTALCSASSYRIELLGPEKTDIAFTPVISVTTDEKYGRVTEDYKDMTKISAFNDEPLSILANNRYASYTFDLSDVYISSLVDPSLTGDARDDAIARATQDWLDLLETPELLSYKYILYNTNYLAQPILKGNLSDILPNGYYYQGSELYDLLSGEQIIGPNQTTYQNIAMTNHIDNISTITANVEFDTLDTMLPSALTLCCIARLPDSSTREISQNTFFMLLYQKNNLRSYKYHHIFENANSNLQPKVTVDQTWSLDLASQSVDLSDICIDDGIYPFRAQNSGAYDRLSALLEFKYSEEDPINREFPNIDPIDVEDEITIVQNDSQSIYYFALDDYRSIDLDVFKVAVYQPAWERPDHVGGRMQYKINPLLPKYRDFYSRALVIEAAYNMEKKTDSDTEYEVVQYFNYKNFTNPQYVSISWPEDTTQPPDAHVCDSTDPSLDHTYLVLRPGQSGRLDIRADFVFYQKLNASAINQSIVGAHSQMLQSYYIMNVSDEKPKFIISRKPFTLNEGVEETDNYELEDAYYDGMAFRYVMMVIQKTRSSDSSTSILNNYVAMSQIAFWDKTHTSRYKYPPESTVSIADGITPEEHLIVYPNVPENLLSENPEKEFFASDLHLVDSALSIVIDLKSQALDITQYPIWSWYNSHCSNSHVGYIPKKFYLAFSNDKQRWYEADDCDDDKNSITTTNYKEAYKAEMHIKE